VSTTLPHSVGIGDLEVLGDVLGLGDYDAGVSKGADAEFLPDDPAVEIEVERLAQHGGVVLEEDVAFVALKAGAFVIGGEG